MRTKEMIANLRNFSGETNSHYQHQKKCTEKNKEKIDTDVRV